MRVRRVVVLPLVAALVAAAFAPVWSQTAEAGATFAWASLRVERDQPTWLELMAQSNDPAIAAALERIAGRPPRTSSYGEWTQWTVSLPAPSRRGLVLQQDLHLEPVLEVLHARGEAHLSLLIRHPSAGFATLHNAPAVSVQPGTLSASLATDSPAPLSLELGWRPVDLWRAAGLLVLALLAPIVAGLWVWRRSIVRDHRPEAWFARVQAIQVVVVAGWALWLVILEATRAADIADFVLESRSPAIVTVACLLGFLPTSFTLIAIARRVVRRLRGFDAPPRGSGPLGSLRAITLLSTLVLAFTGFTASHFRLGVFALLGAMLTALLWPAPGVMGTRPQSLSSGALRDRLFELAHRAGVRLRGLYVVPLRRERMANAFAVHGGSVLVADELLDRMSRREGDAVLAHEITHLEHHHPIKALIAGLTVWGLIAGITIALKIPYGFPVGLVAFWLAHRFVARRFEYAADAGAAALTGDPESVIAGLGALARLNDVPLAWGRWGWLVTHPATEARALAIARRAGLARERTAELLATGLPPTERYGDRERPGEERVF